MCQKIFDMNIWAFEYLLYRSLPIILIFKVGSIYTEKELKKSKANTLFTFEKMPTFKCSPICYFKTMTPFR